MIQIMKASAGSGKTFNLARKYITLLFRKNDRTAYRHILAVTFTNKATDEMKNRILKELFILSSDPLSSGYLKWFMPWRFTEEQLGDVEPDDIVRELPGRPGEEITADSLRDCAREMLCTILHDYSAFSVSTIDKFFQQTLKAFSREIGQFSSYQVELDKDALISETVDRIFDSLTDEDAPLLKWLTDCAISQVENGGSYDITKSLERMASRLKSDEYRDAAEENGIDEDAMYSYGNLQKIRELCASVTDSFLRELGEKAEAVSRAISDCGLSYSDFYGGFPKVLDKYTGLGRNDEVKAPDTFLKRAPDRSLWFSKASMKKNGEKAEGLEVWFDDFCSLFGTPFKEYNTARKIAGQLYELGLYADIGREFGEVLKDRNVLGIDDSNRILKDIIDGADAPFVYEKIGVRYENFLLDEFQDTSRVQWENFRPLLSNSDSQNFENLIVGDVKQSIYRWRGSEWKLLQETLEKEMGHCRTTVLDRNFRSLGNIVDFNNAFFPYAARMLDSVYGEGNVVSDLYSDVEQTAASKSSCHGVVDVSFCNEDAQPGLILKVIEDLRRAGAGYGDIAVLVRKNRSGAEVAEFLIRNSIPVVTDDSLMVKSSGMVRRLVSLMACMDNPRNTVDSYLAGSLDMELPDKYRSLPDLCESLARSLRLHDEAGFDAEATYVQSFVDCVLEYSARNGNSLHDFLEYWEGVEPSISSPALSDSVRIITVHKSKGLDFKYVIFPFAETVSMFSPSDVWCSPDFSGTVLEPAGRGLYDIRLSNASTHTFFDRDFRKERLMQYIDGINLFYVALTRAVKGMHVIAGMPSSGFLKTEKADVPDFRDMSQILYVYLHRYGTAFGFREGEYRSEDVPESFRFGDMPESWDENGRPAVHEQLPSAYPSFELNPEYGEDGAPVRDRLVFSTDSGDYFSEEGKSGLYSSGRLRGIILHRILSSVEKAADLHKAVSDAVADGFLDAQGAAEAEMILSEKLESISSRGWFGDSGVTVFNEVPMIDSDGRIYRPDRVLVHDDGSVTVIDYKFGEKEASHRRQIMHYADMWRRRGCSDVRAYLWYVTAGEVEDVRIVLFDGK